MPKTHTIYVVYSGDTVCRVAATQEEADEIAQRISATKSDVHVERDDFTYQQMGESDE
jgi:hypothetical protein